MNASVSDLTDAMSQEQSDDATGCGAAKRRRTTEDSPSVMEIKQDPPAQQCHDPKTEVMKVPRSLVRVEELLKLLQETLAYVGQFDEAERLTMVSIWNQDCLRAMQYLQRGFGIQHCRTHVSGMRSTEISFWLNSNDDGLFSTIQKMDMLDEKALILDNCLELALRSHCHDLALLLASLSRDEKNVQRVVDAVTVCPSDSASPSEATIQAVFVIAGTK